MLIRRALVRLGPLLVERFARQGGVCPEAVLGRGRRGSLMIVRRRVAAWLYMDGIGLSSMGIGEVLRRDHTTVLSMLGVLEPGPARDAARELARRRAVAKAARARQRATRWTREADLALERFWVEDDLAASAIAPLIPLEPKPSRSAVLGRVYRLGLCRRPGFVRARRSLPSALPPASPRPLRLPPTAMRYSSSVSRPEAPAEFFDFGAGADDGDDQDQGPGEGA